MATQLSSWNCLTEYGKLMVVAETVISTTRPGQRSQPWCKQKAINWGKLVRKKKISQPSMCELSNVSDGER